MTADPVPTALPDWADRLVCPESKLGLTLCTRSEAEERVGTQLVPCRGNARGDPPPVGVQPWVLLRADYRRAYPVVDGVPILLVPEALAPAADVHHVDIRAPEYAEAYEEMEFYHAQGSKEADDVLRSQAYAIVDPVRRAASADRAAFPAPRHVWIDAVYECTAQWDAYAHIAPLRGKRILQIGGTGSHAVKFLLGGAAEAWLVTPMLGEVRCGLALAGETATDDRFRAVVAVAEELPLPNDSFDAIYCGGSLHHTVTEAALPEAARVLRGGGRFAAVDPWRAPFYGIGTAVFGKREPEVHCRPLTPSRVAPMNRVFPEHRQIRHGALSRYPLLALSKLGVACSLSVGWRITTLDDAICSLIPPLRRLGSAVVLLGVKGAYADEQATANA